MKELLLQYVDALPFGKRIGDTTYVHVEGLKKHGSLWSVLVQMLEELGLKAEGFNVVKFNLKSDKLSLLHYPGFMIEGFPALSRSQSISLLTGNVAERLYLPDGNPPILHRKETLLPDDDPHWAVFSSLTSAAEEAGLFDDRSIIGHQIQWEEELRSKGVHVDGHSLITSESKREVDRHRTAIRRYNLSTPMQALWRWGYAEPASRVFDYGCGHGDDIRILRDRGVEANGWDPHFAPNEPKLSADAVNIGFVINVVEDPQERKEALAGAWHLTGVVLSVAALIGGRTAYEKHRLFRDGVLTSRNTFQKYFTQQELGSYIKETLSRDPIAVAPGVFFIFKSDPDEQDFLEKRQRRRVLSHHVTCSPGVRQRKRTAAGKHKGRWIRHDPLLQSFWQRCLSLGRMPTEGEFGPEEQLRDRLGAPKVVLEYLLANQDQGDFEKAQAQRRDDVCVYLALALFERRQPFGALSANLQRDIKALFGSYSKAKESALELLQSVGDITVIQDACVEAHQEGIGWMDGDHSLQLLSSLVQNLPAVLRLYVGCAAVLIGDVEAADVVKIHMQSAKVTLMTYDDFSKPIPSLIERVKIDLRRLRIHFFDYGDEFPPQPLFLKSRLLSEESDEYDHQVAFDKKLQQLELFDLTGFGPRAEEFWQKLGDYGYEILGYDIVDKIPE